MAHARPGDVLDRTIAYLQEVSGSGDAHVGAWMDDPDTLSGVFAAVHNGRLQELVIPNSYLELDATTLSTLINAVIINAFIEWSPAQARRTSHARATEGAAP